VEFGFEDFGKGFDAGASGADEGAVDIEKDEAEHELQIESVFLGRFVQYLTVQIVTKIKLLG
jgi:hypothetical protein